MVKSWASGSIGAWAEEAERAEEEAKQRAASAFPGRDKAFPTLGEAVSAASNQGKKKKPQTLHLSELVAGTYVGPGGRPRVTAADGWAGLSESRGLTIDEKRMLPRAPRDRSEDGPPQGGLGGGFRDYGGTRGAGFSDRGGVGIRDQDRSGGFGSGFHRDREVGGYGRERDRDSGGYGRDKDGDSELLLSRADLSGDWGASKKFSPSQSPRVLDDERIVHRGTDRELPSRANGVEDWSLTKKFVPSQRADWKSLVPRNEGRRGAGFDERPGVKIVSRADEVEKWGAGKKLALEEREGPAAETKDVLSDGDRSSRGIQGVHESRLLDRPRLLLRPRSQSIESSISSQISSKETSPVGEGSKTLGSVLSESEFQPQKPKLRPDPFGGARPREDNLAEKGQDWRKLEAELENREKDITNLRPSTPEVAGQRRSRMPPKEEAYGQEGDESRPSSSHSSRPHTPDMASHVVVRPRPKINPFGDAKPREVQLEKKGKDWRKMDFELEHRSVERPDTEEEINLKKDIKALEEMLNRKIEIESEMNMYGVLCDEDEQESGIKPSIREQLREELVQKEKQLENLTRALDDKIRYSQGSADRPPSQGEHSDAGRGNEALQPSSRAGRSDSGRGMEPVARETKHVEIWTRPTSEVDVEKSVSVRQYDRPRMVRW